MSIPFNKGQLSLLSQILSSSDEGFEIANSSSFGFGYTDRKAVVSLQKQGWISIKPVSIYGETHAWTIYIASIPDQKKERVLHWLSQGSLLNNEASSK